MNTKCWPQALLRNGAYDPPRFVTSLENDIPIIVTHSICGM